MWIVRHILIDPVSNVERKRNSSAHEHTIPLHTIPASETKRVM